MIGLLWSTGSTVVSSLTRPWRQLFWLLLHLYISVWSVAVNWVLQVLAKPTHVLTAFRREKELEILLEALKIDYELANLQNIELQKKLDAFMRDRRRTADTLELVTSDKKKALETTKAFKSRVKELELENHRLLQSEDDLRRGLEDATARVAAATKLYVQDKLNPEDSGLDVGFLQSKDLASKALQDTRMNGKHLHFSHDMTSLSSDPNFSSKIGSEDLLQMIVVKVDQRVAFASSVFSAMLSGLVAVIAWEAQDPCTPLVSALFIVVGMSLANVVQYFGKIKSRQGLYAVALLSLNWFMLGTIAYPALPFIGQVVSAVLWSFAAQVIGVFGFGAIKATNLELLSEF